MKHVLLIGSEGFISQALLNKLISKNYKIFATSRFLKESTDKVEYIKFDYPNYTDLSSISNIKFDIVFYLIKLGTYNQLNDFSIQYTNYELLVKIINDPHLKYKKIIYLSTISAYQFKDEANLCNYYGFFKKLSTDTLIYYCNGNSLKYNIFILPNVFGKGDLSRRSTYQFINKLKNNEDIFIPKEPLVYDMIYIDELINNMEIILDKNLNDGVYYLGNSQLKTLDYYVNEMKKITKSQSKIFYDKNFLPCITDYSSIPQSVIEKTDFEINKSFSIGIEKTIKWYKTIEMENNKI